MRHINIQPTVMNNTEQNKAGGVREYIPPDIRVIDLITGNKLLYNINPSGSAGQLTNDDFGDF